MWSLCLLLGSPRPCHLVVPKHATPSYKVLVPSVSATSLPLRRSPESLPNDDVSNNTQQVGDLGHTLLATLQSNPIPKQQQQRNPEGEGAQISGSDVLWALQRASARNKKKKKNKQKHRRGSSSVASRTEENAVDYTNVRPLSINNHWGAKLDELEKRLRELSDTI